MDSSYVWRLYEYSKSLQVTLVSFVSKAWWVWNVPLLDIAIHSFGTKERSPNSQKKTHKKERKKATKAWLLRDA